VHKESDRAGAIAIVLSAMSIISRVEGDEMLIDGGEVNSTVVSSQNDHRIAMMAAVMALTATGEVTIAGAEAVAKSFPGFYEAMTNLGALVS
jgi:3-phosphoshikimate 1-carboxyvinyltransferase